MSDSVSAFSQAMKPDKHEHSPLGERIRHMDTFGSPEVRAPLGGQGNPERSPTLPPPPFSSPCLLSP